MNLTLEEEIQLKQELEVRTTGVKHRKTKDWKIQAKIHYRI